jgi:hypothetical protein
MNTTATAAETAAIMITDEEFRAEFNRLEREKRMAEVREQNRRSASNGKVWFYKGRDDYGRTVRTVHTMEDGVQRTMGVVVLIPRWNPTLNMKKFFTNDFSVPGVTRGEAILEHDTVKAALARFGCGTVEGERY